MTRYGGMLAEIITTI